MSLSKIGVTGMNSAGSKLESIANNLANSSTNGYKSESLSFSSVYISSGLGSKGAGVKENAANYDMTSGGFSNTGGATDMAIGGNGMFVVQGSDGNFAYTRDGQFEFNQDGELVTQDGFQVMGFDKGSNVLQPVLMPESSMAPAISENVSINANLGGQSDVTTIETSLRVTDSLGEYHDMRLEFSNRTLDPVSGEATWDVTFELNGEVFTGQQITFDGSGSLLPNANGLTDGSFNLDLTTMPVGTQPQGVNSLSIDFSGSTGYSGDMYFRDSEIDGNPQGDMIDFEFSETGEFIAIYSNGERLSQGAVALSSFDNINGLKPISGNKFEATQSSGEAELGRSGENGLGNLNVGFLELSNVDTASQLVEMIEAQQMYQANSKSVTTGREISQTLMNM